MSAAEKLDKAIEFVLDRISWEHDAAKLEHLGNAVQSLLYSKWQYLQPCGTATGSLALLSSAATEAPKKDPLA